MSLPHNVSLLAARRGKNASGSSLGETADSLSREFLGAGAGQSADVTYLKDLASRPYRGVTLLRRSLSDGISFAQTALAALEAMQGHLIEMKQLAEESLRANPAPQARVQLNEAYSERRKALRPLAETTAFAGKRMLTDEKNGMTFQIGAEAGQTLTVPGVRVDAATLGETAWQVLVGGRPRLTSREQIALPDAEAHLTIQGHLVNLEAATSLGGVVDAINALADKTGVTATRAEGNPLWLWRAKDTATDEPPRVGRGSPLAATLGLGAYQTDPDFRLALEDTSVATWGDAAHALKAVGQAISALLPLLPRYEAAVDRFAAVVAFKEAEAEQNSWMRPGVLEARRARHASGDAQAIIKARRSYAVEIQGNSTPTIVLSVLGAR